MPDVSVHLGPNKYGKAENRLVRVTRHGDRHEIADLTVTSQLIGQAFAGSFTAGDNSRIVATDTQKNTVFALAKEHGVGAPEEFLALLADQFTSEFDWVEGGLWQAEVHPWERIEVDGEPHAHSFRRTGSGTRLATVHVEGGERHVTGGVQDLVVLKSTGSEFHGFPRSRFTTLPETTDRIMATEVTARWRYLPAAVEEGIDYDGLYEDVVRVMLEQFATVHSLALQQTLWEMGRAAITLRPELAEVRFAMPNKHHFVVDLSPFGMTNDNEVFIAADRPYGLIEGTVVRDGAVEAPQAWEHLPAFV